MKRPAFALVGLIVVLAFATLTLALVREVSAAPGSGTLFGTDANGGNLITVALATGAGTVVGFMGIGVVPALAVDPTTGIMYAGGGGGVPNLYTVTATGVATFVGNTGLGFAAIGDMDFRADGTAPAGAAPDAVCAGYAHELLTQGLDQSPIDKACEKSYPGVASQRLLA